MNCAHCSTPVRDDATFCHKCGSAVSDAEGQAAATAAMDESHEQQLERMLRAETGGEFEVERLLGKGGMALVYLAREVHLDRKVAVKVLPPELTFGHGVERFKREAKTAAALDHPHIIPIHRIAPGGKLFWYTMKYVEGRSLEDYLRQHKSVSLAQTIEILMPVADALDYAHDKKVVHRDIKPANVMLDEKNRVTVADFGIAKALTEATLTASGSVIGTPYYMSPEQGMGKAVSGASDQYSVAVMAYRMISGQVPFDGDSAIDILHKHCKEPPPPLKLRVPDLPRHVYMAIDKALSKDPADRFSSVTAFVKGLNELSPEISAEMDTVAMESDPSIQEEISTKVMGIRDEDLPAKSAQITPEPEPTATGEAQKKFPWMVVVPVLFLMIAGGVIGGVWLSTGGGESQLDEQSSIADQEFAAAAEDAGTEPPPPEPIPQPTTGTVTVIGLPPTGAVTVDGERQSDTSFALEPGSYTIGLSVPGGQQVETPLTITAGAQVAVPFFAPPAEVTTGTVTVTDLPDGGQITVDGQRQRRSTFELERGDYTIRLSAPGYQPIERDITIAAGTGVTVRFTGTALVASVTLTPSRADIEVGEEVAVSARPLDTAGNPLGGRPVQWSSRDPSIASVNRNGLVRGMSPGTTAIVASVEDQAAAVNVTVTEIAVAAVSVAPENSAVFEGENITLSASVLDQSGRPMAGREVAWRSSDRAVATVSSTGVVTGVRAGTATISAAAGGKRGSSALTVKAVVVEEQIRPQPTEREISGPEDLFARAAPEGWRLVSSEPPEIAKYDSRMGVIRILRAREQTPERILAGLRTAVSNRMTSFEELAPPSWFTTEQEERILWQPFAGIEGSGFNEARFRVILAAARNEYRGVGVVALLEQYADPDQGYADLRTLLESLRR